jgi:CubicO group peptidase (beta-lactamase class C family)
VARRLRIALAALAIVEASGGATSAQSLEEQTRRPRGTDSLHDDSERLRGDAPAGTDSLDDDSMQLRGRTADQDGTNSLDDGSLDGGDRPDND